MGLGSEDELERFGVAEKQSAAKLIESLSSPNHRQRRAAASKLQYSRRAVAEQLSANLHRIVTAGNLEETFEGETHLVLRLIAQWRVDESLTKLTEIVTFKLDAATFPAGIKVAPAAYYPAASAVAEIGGQRAITSMLDKIEKSDEDKDIRICTWVLYKILGEDLAKAGMEQRAESAPAKDIEDRFLHAASLVNKGESLLPYASPLQSK